MKKIILCLFIFFCALSLCGCEMPSLIPTKSASQKTSYSANSSPKLVSAENIGGSATEVALAVSPAVVGIQIKTSTSEIIGSGVCVASNGYILTNHHVVGDNKTVDIYFNDQTSTTAEVVWKEENLDLAVLKSKVASPAYLEMSSAKALSVGQDILAIGTPISLDFAQTVTKGIVSAVGRTIETETGFLQSLVQHDASINPGNSGGPLINMSGQVVGINTLKADQAEALGFAIPIDVAIPVIKSIAETGSFSAPSLGIFGFDASMASFNEMSLAKNGIYIANIVEKSAISKTEAKVGDVIVKFNDVEVHNMLDLRTELYYHKAGDSVSLEVISGESTKTITFTL